MLMKNFFNKLLTLGELLLGFAFIIVALQGLIPLFILRAITGIAGFFIVLDGLEHIDDPVQNQPPHNDDTNSE